MITKSLLFRQHHFLELLKSFDLDKGPIDGYVNNYFRNHPQLGSKDRLYIVERIYKYFRWKLLIQALEQEGGNFLELLDLEFSLVTNKNFPPHVRVSFPESLFKAFQKSFPKNTEEVCLACNEKAPITIRVNPLKTTREALREKLRAHDLEAEEVQGVPFALKLNRRSNLVALQEFKDGLFEIQDAGSQKVAECIEAHPGDQVLDFCAGAGGKTLAFAHRLEGKGQVFLYDIRDKALDEAKKRLRRAGIQNTQIIYPEEKAKLSKLKGKMDWVILDVPCSGTGTLRRNPDMKWKFSENTLASLVQEQRAIFSQGVSFLKPGGSLLYATCSILKDENEEQLAYFLENFPVEIVQTPFSSLPSKDMDGFFAVRLRLK